VSSRSSGPSSAKYRSALTHLGRLGSRRGQGLAHLQGHQFSNAIHVDIEHVGRGTQPPDPLLGAGQPVAAEGAGSPFHLVLELVPGESVERLDEFTGRRVDRRNRHGVAPRCVADPGFRPSLPRLLERQSVPGVQLDPPGSARPGSGRRSTVRRVSVVDRRAVRSQGCRRRAVRRSRRNRGRCLATPRG